MDGAATPDHAADFPWRLHSAEECAAEFQRLKRALTKAYTWPLIFSTIGYMCTNVYFQFERMETARSNWKYTFVHM